MSLKFLVPAATAALAATAFAAPTVSDVTMQQNGHRVDITYKLDADAIVTLDVQTNGVSIGYDKIIHLSGDVNVPVKSGTGTHRIVWTPYKDWPDGGTLASAKAVVTAWAYDAPPPYCAVSIASADKAVRFFPDEKAIPRGVQDRQWKTDWLLLRKIPAAGVTWLMGTPKYSSDDPQTPAYAYECPHRVTLSADYYMGVYEITIAQWKLFNSTWMGNGSLDKDPTMPAHGLTFSWIRGTSAGAFVGWLRARNGSFAFDLPTDAQWEFAARAGNGAQFADGSDSYSSSSPYYWDNDTTLYAKTLHEVGTTSLPNAWGLYDMCGSVFEPCLDNFRGSITTDETDPLYLSEDTSAPHVMRSCGFGEGLDWDKQPYRRSVGLAHRKSVKPTSGGGADYGFRICAPAVYTPAP